MKVSGITRRWLVNGLGLIFVIIIVLVAGFSVGIKNYYYGAVQQNLTSLSHSLTNHFSRYIFKDYKIEETRDFVENFSDKEKIELMTIGRQGKIFITSSGVLPSDEQPMPDYDAALKSKDGVGQWTGKLSNGENVIARTTLLRNPGGNRIGAIRFVVSRTLVDRQILFLDIVLLFVGLGVLGFVILSNVYFINSIVSPVRRVSKTARKIAAGHFDVRIRKQYNDEIGDLCDTINYMASELAASEKLKNDFISSVSHEIRTPLTSIKGWSETLSHETGDEETIKKGLRVISYESQRLSDMVEELLDFSSMQGGRFSLKLEPTDLLGELYEVVVMFSERAQRENIELIFIEPDHELPIINADTPRLRQVFVNILDNAFKYSEPTGKVILKVEETDGEIRVIVADTGCGIPADQLGKVKEKFFKGNQLRRGSGIGLALSDEIVTMHGGRLEIESEEGQGTIVTIVLKQNLPSQNQA